MAKALKNLTINPNIRIEETTETFLLPYPAATAT